MISLSVVSDAGYFHSMGSEHAMEYFSENQKVDGFWQGILAEKEGLVGKEISYIINAICGNQILEQSD
jgi:hypothetical protein